MKILSFTKAGSEPYRDSETFDSLWEQAEQLGRVSVETRIFGTGGKYEAEIVFNRLSGTSVYAKARHDSRTEALRGAIIEAVELGAQ